MSGQERRSSREGFREAVTFGLGPGAEEEPTKQARSGNSDERNSMCRSSEAPTDTLFGDSALCPGMDAQSQHAGEMS